MLFAKHGQEHNFFGPDEWREHFYQRGIRLTPEQLQVLEVFPWSEDILLGNDPFGQKHKNDGPLKIMETHFAFCGIDRVDGMHFLAIREWANYLASENFKNIKESLGNLWFENEDFATKRFLACRWYLVPYRRADIKRFVTHDQRPWELPENFFYRLGKVVGTPREAVLQDIVDLLARLHEWHPAIQQSREAAFFEKLFLNCNYSMLYAAEAATKEILFIKKNGVISEERWLCRDIVRRRDGDMQLANQRVYVGSSPKSGLDIFYLSDYEVRPDTGIALTRKPLK